MKISVVMPVHNSGRYYKETMDSLLAQTFREFEIICVDDASEDIYTQELLKEYEFIKRDIPISVIRLKEPRGAAEARNIGFLHITGKYVIFLDSDDIFSSNFLEMMYEGISKEEADVCVCGATEFFEDAEGRYQIGLEYKLDGNIMENREGEEWLLRITTVPWNKLCKAEFLRSNHIYFQTLSSHNDVFFSCMVMVCAKRVYELKKNNLIRYRTKTNTQISANRNAMNLYYVIQLLLEQEKNAIFYKQCCALLLLGVPSALQRCKDLSYKKEFYNTVKQFFIENNICFQSKLFNRCKQQMIELPYESHCYLNWISFEGRLEMFSDKIIELVAGENVILWGNGKRGQAFQAFCKKYAIDIVGVVDKTNKNVGTVTEYGFLILNTEDVGKRNEVIVASNRLIYEELCLKNVENELINLEEFC